MKSLNYLTYHLISACFDNEVICGEGLNSFIYQMEGNLYKRFCFAKYSFIDFLMHENIILHNGKIRHLRKWDNELV